MQLKKSFTLIIVRHGQGFHNLGTLSRDKLEFTNDEQLRTLNSCLTEKGLMQAGLVADRLKDTKFDLAITSDLKRAMQTGEAIMKKNDSITALTTWKIVRERCLGDFEAEAELHRPLRKVENAVEDRNSLTFRPPNGESVFDLRSRIFQFIQDLQNEALKIPTNSPVILVSSHGLFMDELYRVISEKECGKSLPKEMPGYQNTGIAKYEFITNIENDTELSLDNVECPVRSCAIHLKGHDETFEFCQGGCHGILDDQILIEMNN